MKHLDGVPVVLWWNVRVMVWDAIIHHATFAPSYILTATSEAGALAALTENRKNAMYIPGTMSLLHPSHHLVFRGLWNTDGVPI